jgi:uncharacterized membrane protein YfcA
MKALSALLVLLAAVTTVQACQSDSDCESVDLVCHSQACVHKSLSPFTANDGGTMAIGFVFCLLAAGTGIGGGGLLVPVFILMAHFDPKDAIPLSKATIFGGAIANLLLNAQRPHPKHAAMSIISGDISMVMEPSTLAATTLGVILNKLLPNWLLLVLLEVTLLLTVGRLIVRGLREAKSDGCCKPNRQDEHPMQPLDEVLTAGSIQEVQPDPPIRKWNWKSTLVLFIAWVIVLITALAREHSTFAIDCGSPLWWFIFAITFVALAALTFAVFVHLSRRDTSIETEFHWHGWKKISVFIGSSFFAGILASMLGVGGGMITTPLLLELGLLPEVAAATSSWMILWTSSSTTLQFLVLGRLRLDYAGVFAAVGFVSTLVGQFVIFDFLKRKNKNWVIIFIVAGAVLLTCILMGVLIGTRMTSSLEGLGSVCA